jgi:hypothetical protein
MLRDPRRAMERAFGFDRLLPLKPITEQIRNVPASSVHRNPTRKIGYTSMILINEKDRSIPSRRAVA